MNIAIRLFLLTASPVILGITGCGAVSSSCTDTLEPFRTESESFFLTADASPFSEEFRKEFSGLSFFEANETYCIDSSFELDEQSETVDYPAFNNKTIPFRQFGTFYFEIDGKPQSLVAHQRIPIVLTKHSLPAQFRRWRIG